MRIAFVYDIPYPWHRGGIEHILNIEAKELAKKHDVHFFTMKWNGMRSDFTYQNVKYHAMGSVTEDTAYRHGRRSIREAAMFTIYLNELFKYDFDIVISNAFPVLHLPVIRQYCNAKHCKLILKVDEVWDREYWVDYLGRFFGEMANLYANTFIKSGNIQYVANSTTTADRLAQMVNKDRISIFAPVLEDDLIEEAKKLKGKKKDRIIFSGRFIKEKRLDKWLNIVKKVIEKKENVHALLIGEGHDKERMIRRIKELHLERKVKVRPFFKDKVGMLRELADSKALLNMSEREGLSIIALESIALGTPVVLPDYSPIPKEVKEMCIVEKEDKLPSKIIEVLNNPNKYLKKKDNLKMFSTSSVIDFYERLFKK